MQMQRQNAHARQTVRAPMLDLTNMQQMTFDNIKLAMGPPSGKAGFQPMTTRAYTTMDCFDAPKCSHSVKLRSNNPKFAHCVECGAFVSSVRTQLYPVGRRVWSPGRKQKGKNRHKSFDTVR